MNNLFSALSVDMLLPIHRIELIVDSQPLYKTISQIGVG